MAGINKVILVGHLGKDPDVRMLDSGIKIATFPFATNETYKKDGKRMDITDWHNIVFWRNLADRAEQVLVKGRLIYIEGKLKTRNFEDKDGHKRYVTEVIASDFTLLGRRSDFSSNKPNSVEDQKTDDIELDLDSHDDNNQQV